MDNFDKLFQNKLNEINENDFEFKESSWERFHKNMEVEEAVPKRGVVPMVWLKRNAVAAAVILLLLTSNVFFAKQFLSTRNDVKALTSTIENLKTDIVSCQERSENYTQTVASLKGQVEAQTTLIGEQSALISEVRNENENSNSNANANANKNANKNENKNANANANENASRVLGTNANLNNGNGLGNNIDNNIENNTNEVSNNGGIVTINGENDDENDGAITKPLEQEVVKSEVENIELNRLDFTLDNSNAADTKWWEKQDSTYTGHQKTSLGTKGLLLAEASKPSAYQIGASFQFSPILTAKGLDPILAMNTGISANALFFNRLRLGIGADRWLHTINFDAIETAADGVYDDIIPNLTTLNPNNPQDELNKLEGEIRGFDVPLTAEILLRPTARWSPYLGFGVVGRYYDNYNFEHYFYENGSSAYRYEMKVQGQVRQFDLSLWQSKVGMDFKMSNHWLLNGELSYLKSYREQIYGLKNVQQFGVRIGIKYQF